MNNIYIDEYLCLSDFFAQNLARNKKSRCLNRKSYVLFHILECRLVGFEMWSFFIFLKKILTRIYVFVILYMYLRYTGGNKK